jgi:hypothetical protein
MTGYENAPERTANDADQSANGGWVRWRPGPARGGKGGRAAAGERTARHRSPRVGTPVPTSGEGAGDCGHHDNLIIAHSVEVLPTTLPIFPSTCIVCPLFTHVAAPRRLKAREGSDHR